MSWCHGGVTVYSYFTSTSAYLSASLLTSKHFCFSSSLVYHLLEDQSAKCPSGALGSVFESQNTEGVSTSNCLYSTSASMQNVGMQCQSDFSALSHDTLKGKGHTLNYGLF